MITSSDIINNKDIRTYIQAADRALEIIGYTEHSYPHTVTTAMTAHEVLIELGYDERTADLAKIAGYMHDIGNLINRYDHAHSSAIMSFKILTDLGMPTDEIVRIVSAIGNHDEQTANPISEITAALILADKSDVRRSRVRGTDLSEFDIHDRVNYSVLSADLEVIKDEKLIRLVLSIDESICTALDYFGIYIERMQLCRRAASFLGCTFKIIINGTDLS